MIARRDGTNNIDSNPWLYSKAYKTFTDVTIGSSFGCGTNGFPAQAGWDAVTGFGTPVCLMPPPMFKDLLLTPLSELRRAC